MKNSLKSILVFAFMGLFGWVLSAWTDADPFATMAMSTVAGAFTETQLQEIRVMADRIGMDGRVRVQYQPKYISALLAVLQNQSSRIRELETPQKTKTVEIEWMNACELAVSDAANCTFDGTELSTNTEQYALDLVKWAEFKVNEDDFIDNDFGVQKAIAKGYLRADKVLADWLGQRLITEIEAAKGTNAFSPTGGKGTVSGTDTYIAAQYWDHTLMAYFARVATHNEFNSPFMIDGSNLIEQVQVADWERGNDNGKGKMAAFGSLTMYFDELTVDTVNADKRTYMIDRGVIAVANKADYPASVTHYHAQDRFSIDSQFLPGFKYDVHYTTTCDTVTDRIIHSFKVKLTAGIFFNPAGCTASNTGVLAFVCGAVPAN